MKTAEEALKCYSNTTAMIFICGKIMCFKRPPIMLKMIISDFYLTSALLGKKAQPQAVLKAVVKVMHSLWAGLFHLETPSDDYIQNVISDLILHWTPQFANEFNTNGAVLPFIKFTRANMNTHLPSVLLERLCKVLLSSYLQRDMLAMKLLKEFLGQSKEDPRMLKILLSGCLLRVLEYHCKCEDFAPVKKLIMEFLEEISTLNFINENAELS